MMEFYDKSCFRGMQGAPDFIIVVSYPDGSEFAYAWWNEVRTIWFTLPFYCQTIRLIKR